ncbi:MAG: VWA domain-containing protein [Proteobacteria bacterium]|nr:VWA domain-containing protein [Pseudomonadota bacterium]
MIHSFAYPHLLFLIPCCVVMAILLSYLARKKELTLLGKWGDNAQALISHSFHSWRHTMRTLFICLGYVSLVCALSQPRAGFTLEEHQSEGRNILVAVDVSRSMLADDFKPSRLERAKREILDLMKLLEGDRIGLIVFAGEAYIYLPLTRDYQMAELFVSQLSTKIMESQGTDLGRALTVALRSLKKHPDRPLESRDLLIITDGEDHPQEVMTAAQQAKDMGVRIFTMGVGSAQGALLKMPDGSYVRDHRGHIVLSKLDEKTLKSIASITGGKYVLSDAATDDMQHIYQQGIRAKSTVVMDSEEGKVWDELFPWFLLISLISWFTAFFISPYSYKPHAMAIIMLFTLIDIPKAYGSIFKEDIHKDFIKARHLMENADNSPDHLDHLNEAKQLLEGIVKTPASKVSKDLLHASYFNLSHVLMKMGQHDEAFKALKKAYAMRQDHQPTLENLQWLAKFLEEKQQQQQQQQQQNQQQNANGDSKDNSSSQTQKPQDSKSPSQQQSASSANQPGDGKQEHNDQHASSSKENHTHQNAGHQNTGKEEEGHDNNHKEDDHKNAARAENTDQAQTQENSKNTHNDQKGDKDSGADSKDNESVAAGSTADSGDKDTKDDQQESQKGMAVGEPSETTDPQAMDPQQAINLFRALEDNREAYGRYFPEDRLNKRDFRTDSSTKINSQPPKREDNGHNTKTW